MLKKISIAVFLSAFLVASVFAGSSLADNQSSAVKKKPCCSSMGAKGCPFDMKTKEGAAQCAKMDKDKECADGACEKNSSEIEKKSSESKI